MATATKSEGLVIAPLNMPEHVFTIRGIAPYVQNKFSSRVLQGMRATQEAGSLTKKGKKRDAKDFEQCYEEAMHRSPDGWCGIPAPAFRNACIDVCRMVGFKMTHTKMSVFVEADGFDVEDATPLVRISKGEPHYTEMLVRNATGVADVRPRPMWAPGWEAEVRIKFDADQFTLNDMTNLLIRAGRQVGVGEGRPYSKNSAGMGWGLFDVVSVTG